MIRFKHKGNFNNTERLFRKGRSTNVRRILDIYGQKGVDALALATPRDSGVTAASWGYEIVQTERGASIFWTNANVNDGVNIALILQYGHGTRNGGYVQGRDYINPAIAPVFDEMAEQAWKEVTS